MQSCGVLRGLGGNSRVISAYTAAANSTGRPCASQPVTLRRRVQSPLPVFTHGRGRRFAADVKELRTADRCTRVFVDGLTKGVFPSKNGWQGKRQPVGLARRRMTEWTHPGVLTGCRRRRGRSEMHPREPGTRQRPLSGPCR